MFTDPLSSIIHQHGWPWFWFVIGYALLDIAVNAIFLYRRGEFKQSLRADRLLLLWPIFTLVPVTAFFLYTSQVSIDLNTHFVAMARTDLFIFRKGEQLAILLLIFVVSIIHTGISYYRYEKLDRDKPAELKRFFTRSAWFHLFRVSLFDFPLAIMVLIAGLRVVEHSFTIHHFLSSLSLPASFLFPPDNMYGFKWIYDIILNYFVLGVMLSFLPAIMLIREKDTQYSVVYKSGIILLELAVIVLSSLLAYDFHIALQSVYYHFLYPITASIVTDANAIRNMTDHEIARQELYLNLYDILNTFPNSFPIPTWLQSILGLRFITYFIEIYPLIPPKFWKRLPFPASFRNLLNIGRV